MTLERSLTVQGRTLAGPDVRLTTYDEPGVDWPSAEIPGDIRGCYLRTGSFNQLWDSHEPDQPLHRALYRLGSCGTGLWAVEILGGRRGARVVGVGRLREGSTEGSDNQMDLAIFGESGLDDDALTDVARRAGGGLAEIARRSGSHLVRTQHGEDVPGRRAAELLRDVGFLATAGGQITDVSGDRGHWQIELVTTPRGLSSVAAERKIGQQSLARWQAFTGQTLFEPRA